MRTGKPLFGGNEFDGGYQHLLTTGQKLTRHDVFMSFWVMGHGGAPPMQVEIEEDDVRYPTGEFSQG